AQRGEVEHRLAPRRLGAGGGADAGEDVAHGRQPAGAGSRLIAISLASVAVAAPLSIAVAPRRTPPARSGAFSATTSAAAALSSTMSRNAPDRPPSIAMIAAAFSAGVP